LLKDISVTLRSCIALAAYEPTTFGLPGQIFEHQAFTKFLYFCWTERFRWGETKTTSSTHATPNPFNFFSSME